MGSPATAVCLFVRWGELVETSLLLLMLCGATTQKGTPCKLQTPCRYHGGQSIDRVKGWIYVYMLDGPGHVYNGDKYVKLNRWYHKLLGKQSRLIKVGYTTTSPRVRLKQWQRQCGCQIRLVGPKTDGGLYDRLEFGWSTERPKAAEKAAHSLLRQKYGRGLVMCGGCVGVHSEWFLVADKDLPDAFKTIEAAVVTT